MAFAFMLHQKGELYNMNIKLTGMIALFLSAMLSILSCHSSKQSAAKTEMVSATEDTAPDSMPVCIKAMIKEFKSETRGNPPRKIFSYIYNGKKVYYVTAVCCDNFSDLYNSNCQLIGHPDGGFTGRGDGKYRDFSTERKNEKLLWEDTRKN